MRVGVGVASDGAMVGVCDGTRLGHMVGAADGARLCGARVGTAVGRADGRFVVGLADGRHVGNSVSLVGACDGTGVGEMKLCPRAVGKNVGEIERAVDSLAQ